jgi:REP element-mobilizing transposase RayT
MKYNPDKHNRKSIRLKEYDYSQAGFYFITICAYNREHLFGQINDGIMVLNELGSIVEDWLKNIKIKYPNCELDYYCIMPNHIHFILKINDTIDSSSRGGVAPPLPKPKLGNIIGFTKYQSTKQINILRKTPGIPIGQRNYYEHIIQNEEELFDIRNYIVDNPLNWDEDEYK